MTINTDPPPALSMTQYGVATPDRGTVLIVSTDRTVAQDALTWIQDGVLVTRTLTVGAWQPSAQTHDDRHELERTEVG